MQYLLFGLVALVLGLVAAQSYATAKPGAMARQVRATAGTAALLVGTILLLRGAVVFGAGLVAGGLLALLGSRIRWSTLPTVGAPPRRVSRLVTEHLDLELELDTGAIQGRVLKGFFGGRDIEALRPVELAHLWSDCRFADPESAQVLEVYLDRVHPTWRADMARTADGASADVTADSGTMTVAQAYEILGLAAGASEAEIRRAHRDLMLKLHPDRGGSHTLAAKVNEAKDVLLQG
jgi:DnaJ domain